MSRPKGSPNKVGAQVKENILAVFTRLGGTAGMADWAKENQTEFYKLYGRLIPTEMVGNFFVRDARELSDEELVSIATASSAGDSGEAAGETESQELH